MPSMYDDSTATPLTEQAASLAGKAALWTDAAQQKYARLTALPDDQQRTVRMEIGYLQQAKQAAEELSRKAN